MKKPAIFILLAAFVLSAKAQDAEQTVNSEYRCIDSLSRLIWSQYGEQLLQTGYLLKDFIKSNKIEQKYPQEYTRALESIAEMETRNSASWYNKDKALESNLEYKDFLETINHSDRFSDFDSELFKINKRLAELYLDSEDYLNAEKCYLAYLNYTKAYYDKDHNFYVDALVEIAEFYEIYKRDYKQVEQYLSEALIYLNKKSNYETLKKLGYAKLVNGKIVEGSNLLTEASFLWYNYIYEGLLSSSEYWRTSVWQLLSGKVDEDYSHAYLYGNDVLSKLSYNNALMSKGLLLRTATGVRDAVVSSGNANLIDNWEKLNALQQQLKTLEVSRERDSDYSKLLVHIDSLDRAITGASQAYRDLKTDLSMKWQDVQKQLKPNEAAVEFVHFRLYDKDWKDSIMYVALVLRSDMKSPVWIPLCEQKELEAVLQPTVKDTQKQTENLYVDNGEKLYQLVWQDMEKELPGVKTIYYSPSGLLHKIAFSAMPTDRENVLLSDKYDLHLLSSTREIARLKKGTASLMQDATVVYGGLTYDRQQLAQHRPKKQEPETQKRYRDKDRRPAAELPSAELRSGFSEWKYLAGTKAEAEQIVSSLESKRVPYQSYAEDKGNEESFKELSDTKTGVIHLATHGFFLPDIENKIVENLVQRLGAGKEKPFENPLLRSGLIMSGANEQWIAKEYITDDDMEDGILTADEISRLNLTKTKLVVMSACETGLGDAKNSEGVFGLQRAFKLAGVESLIMSLWKVPDDATADLMTTFYTEWLKGQTKQAAFKAAQRKVREKYQSPYYWAAFVMMD